MSKVQGRARNEWNRTRSARILERYVLRRFRAGGLRGTAERTRESGRKLSGQLGLPSSDVGGGQRLNPGEHEE